MAFTPYLLWPNDAHTRLFIYSTPHEQIILCQVTLLVSVGSMQQLGHSNRHYDNRHGTFKKSTTKQCCCGKYSACNIYIPGVSKIYNRYLSVKSWKITSPSLASSVTLNAVFVHLGTYKTHELCLTLPKNNQNISKVMSRFYF